MRRALPLLCAAVLSACGSTPRRDLDFDRLHASLEALATDPELAKLALAERALAEAAVRRLDASSINAAEHAQLAYVAERRVDIAYVAAQTEREAARLTELQREHASLLLAASRRETEVVRAELDRQRQRELLQQEDVQRSQPATPRVAIAPPPAAVAVVPPAPTNPLPAPVAAPPPESSAPAPAVSPPPAAPASVSTEPSPVPAPAPAPSEVVAPPASAPAAETLAQRLAELAPDSGSDGRQITLEDLVFEPGTATFATEAEAGLVRVAAWAAAKPASAIRIEGHTDATGSPDANRALSLRRAEAVRDALIARGIAAARIAVSGEGAAQPVASNDDPAGRARNRRVVVRLGDG